MLLMISLLLLISQGCSWTDTVVVKPVPVYCPKSPRPVLTELDKTKPIYHEDNAKIMAKDLNITTTHIYDLEATIKCYKDSNSK